MDANVADILKRMNNSPTAKTLYEKTKGNIKDIRLPQKTEGGAYGQTTYDSESGKFQIQLEYSGKGDDLTTLAVRLAHELKHVEQHTTRLAALKTLYKSLAPWKHSSGFEVSPKDLLLYAATAAKHSAFGAHVDKGEAAYVLQDFEDESPCYMVQVTAAKELKAAKFEITDKTTLNLMEVEGKESEWRKLIVGNIAGGSINYRNNHLKVWKTTIDMIGKIPGLKDHVDGIVSKNKKLLEEAPREWVQGLK